MPDTESTHCAALRRARWRPSGRSASSRSETFRIAREACPPTGWRYPPLARPRPNSSGASAGHRDQIVTLTDRARDLLRTHQVNERERNRQAFHAGSSSHSSKGRARQDSNLRPPLRSFSKGGDRGQHNAAAPDFIHVLSSSKQPETTASRYGLSVICQSTFASGQSRNSASRSRLPRITRWISTSSPSIR